MIKFKQLAISTSTQNMYLHNTPCVGLHVICFSKLDLYFMLVYLLEEIKGKEK